MELLLFTDTTTCPTHTGARRGGCLGKAKCDVRWCEVLNAETVLPPWSGDHVEESGQTCNCAPASAREMPSKDRDRLCLALLCQAVCIENSCMVRGSKQGRNGAIHIFREIIKPAEKSLHEKLKQDKRFR